MAVSFTEGKFTYIHGATAGTLLKTGEGTLLRVVLNTLGTTPTMTLYDAVSATNPIAIITPTVAGGRFEYECKFTTGLFVVTTAADADWTIVYK